MIVSIVAVIAFIFLIPLHHQQVHADEGATMQGSFDLLLNRINRIHDMILPEDLPYVRDSKERLAERLNDSGSTALIIEIWNKINILKGTASGYDRITGDNLLKLTAAIDFAYYEDGRNIEQLRADTDFIEMFNQLDRLAGLEQVWNGDHFDDIAAFILAVEAGMKSAVNKKTLVELVALSLNEEAINGMIGSAVQDVLNRNHDLWLSKLLQNLNIQPSDLAAAYRRIAEEADPDKKARMAIAAAYLRTEADYTSTVLDNGRQLTSTLRILGRIIPNVFLEWTKESGDEGVFVSTNGDVKLEDGYSSGSAVIKATDILFGKEWYKGPVSLASIDAEETVDLSVVTPGTFVNTGENTTVTIKVWAAEKLYRFNMLFSYDPDLFELVDVHLHEQFEEYAGSASLSYSSHTDGVVSLTGSLLGSAGKSGDIGLINLTLKAKHKDTPTWLTLNKDAMFTSDDGFLYRLNTAVSKQIVIANADVTNDSLIAVNDLVGVAKAFGKQSGEEGYSPKLDMNKDQLIDIVDMAYVALKMYEEKG